MTESEYREVIDEKGTLENLELASQSIKNVFRYIDQLEARVTFLEKENQALGEKLEKVKNYNKNPRVAQINKSKANENALRLLKHFREAIEEGYKSNKAIAERLTQKGVKTPRGNEKWQFTTVHNYRKRLRSLGHQI